MYIFTDTFHFLTVHITRGVDGGGGLAPLVLYTHTGVLRMGMFGHNCVNIFSRLKLYPISSWAPDVENISFNFIVRFFLVFIIIVQKIILL